MAIAGGVSIAVLLPVLPAVGDHSPIGDESPPAPVIEVVIDDDATLGARGAVVFVPVEVSCGDHADAGVDVRVTQRVGRVVTVGTAFTGVVECTGEFQSVIVAATPDSGSRVFRRGVAFAQVHAFAVFPPPNGQSTEAEDSGEIRVRRAGQNRTPRAA